MSQMNLDKLNLLLPPSVTPSSSRSPRPEAPGVFGEHLERASNSGASGAATDRQRPESPVERPAPSQSDHREPVEAAEAPSRQPESNQDRDDKDQSGAALPEAAEETEAAETNAAGDEAGTEGPEEESEPEAASVDAQLVAEIAAVAPDENPAAGAQEASAESEQVSPDPEPADVDAEAKAAKTRGELDKTTRDLLARQRSGEQSETAQETQGDPTDAGRNDAAPEGNAAGPDDGRATAAERSRSLREDRAAGRQTAEQAFQAAVEDPGAQSTAKEAESADPNGLGSAARRLAGSESGAAAHPIPAAAEGIQPTAEAAMAQMAGDFEAVKPAGGATARNAAAAENQNQNPHASPADQVDRVRFVQRVAGALEAAHARGGHLRLRLHPPELGSLRLEITVQNGVMNARLEAESAAARSLLLDNLPALRERLAEMDVKIQQFDVELDARSSGGPPQGPGDQQQGYDTPRRGGAAPDPARQTAAETAAIPAAGVRPSGTSQFDVTI